MKTQMHAQLRSGLPVDDTHPYRTGAWRPQTTEWDAWDLDVVGAIPHDLAGTYLRNTENPVFDAKRAYHPFDGDGMLHSMTFEGGSARYANRFVQTDGFIAEQQAERSLWAGIAEAPSLSERPGACARGAMKDAASTDVVVHAGAALASFYQCGDLYRLDPVTLAPLGRTDLGSFARWGVSAHTKLDEHTGELLFFSYAKEPPYLRFGVLDATGALSHEQDVELPGVRLPHDMAFTEDYVILNDCPLFWDPELLARGVHANVYRPELPTRFAVIDRHGPMRGRVRWFEAEPTFVLHWTNAYQDGDRIVLDGFHQTHPSPEARPEDGPTERMFRFLDLHRMEARHHRWTFDLATGVTSERHLSDRIMEFPAINGRVGGRPYRYAYNAISKPGWFLFTGLVKHDVVTGHEQAFSFPDGTFCSEAVFAPRAGTDASADEDDGYVLTFTSDVVNDTSACWIFDANDLTEPVAQVALPERISAGTHACWSGS